MAVLRCERLAAGDVDGAVATLGTLTLARTPDGSFVELDDRLVARARRAFAFAGVRLSDANDALAPRPGTRAAIGRDLTALPAGAIALDLVHVRALPLGAETRKLLRAPPARGPNLVRRSLVRDLLHGANAVVGWRRRAWASRETLRMPAARRVLLPVIFDLGAIAAPPEHRAFAKDGAIGAWLFG